MKKQIITKVLLACFIMALGGFVLNLQAQDAPIVVEFTNPDGGDYGSSNEGYLGIGLGGSGSGSVPGAEEFVVDDPYVEFAFTIGGTGQISLDVITPTTYAPIVDVLNTWDNDNIGATTNSALYGKSFSLILTAESRMQLGSDSDGNRGGIGIRGENQRRMDDTGEDNEWMQFELFGDGIGIDFFRIGYNDVSGDALAHAIIRDHDSDEYIPIIDGIDGDPHPAELYIDAADFNMRYFSDILYLSTADSLEEGGYRLYSIEFNVVPAEPKPPAVLSTTPAHADTTVETTADYVIQFDLPIEQATASGAISFTPDVSNRVETWNAAGDELTISFDQLPYATDYVVSITSALVGTSGLNMLADTTFTFKTLPEPPTVLYTFPANLSTKVPVTSPFELRFSKGMIDTTVEKSIEFTPPLEGMDFIWNADNSILYFSTDEMSGSTQYFVTVGTDATDRFGVQLAAPFQFVFTTANAVGVDNQKLSKMILYPNPADDVLTIRGIDVKSAKLYTMTGQIVREISNKSLIDVSEINPGAYIINVKDRNDNNYKEVIIIK